MGTLPWDEWGIWGPLNGGMWGHLHGDIWGPLTEWGIWGPLPGVGGIMWGPLNGAIKELLNGASGVP